MNRLLWKEGIAVKHVAGYDATAAGHLAAAYAVSSGAADCCLATSVAARAFGLDFVPLHRERFDLVLRSELMESPVVSKVLDLLHRGTLRRKLESLAGYDTGKTGTILGQ